jgi:hypothetical protein
LQAHFETIPHLDLSDGDLDDEVGDHVNDLIEKLDERIAGTLATTTPGVIGQVRLLERSDERNADPQIADGVVATLTASISAGIERPAGRAELVGFGAPEEGGAA